MNAVLRLERNDEVILKYLPVNCNKTVGYNYGRTLSDASMLYFADVFLKKNFYGRLSWPNG